MLAPDLVELSSNKQFAELRLTPKTHGPVTEEAIRHLLALPDFANLCPLDSQIAKAVKDVNKLYAEEDGQFEQFFQIAERRDGQISLQPSKDKMQAGMTLTAAWGGKEITLPDILRRLKEEKICMGLSKIKIETMLKRLKQSKPGETIEGTIACGKAAVNGNHARLDRKVPLARERLLHPQEREDGTVDMRNLGAVIMVNAGDLLMERIPATQGTPGYNVFGEVLPAKPGKDLEMVAGKGTEFSAKDSNKLIATVAGQPVEVRNGMQVDDVLQIKDVDVGYGNVDFKGSILISGDVHEGMQVKSSGDITVMGFVDSASLMAEGDVTVSKGIIGRQIRANELSTQIRAKGQISAQFVQYSDLQCQGDILVTKQLLHSNSRTDSKLTVSDANGRRGDLVGGIAKAEKGIKAVAIGATADTKTDLFCAMRLGEYRQNLKDLEESVRVLVVAGLDMEARLRKLPPKSEWQADPAMVEQVKMMLEEKHRVDDERVREETELELLKAETEGYYRHYFVEALKHIYSNVEIHIGPAQQRTQREHGPCVVQNQNGEVHFDYSSRG